MTKPEGAAIRAAVLQKPLGGVAGALGICLAGRGMLRVSKVVYVPSSTASKGSGPQEMSYHARFMC